MNEILALRQVKRVMKYGVPKSIAKGIVEDVIGIVGAGSIAQLEYAVNYAVSLTYRIEFSKIVK